jgi:hypothetical protein
MCRQAAPQGRRMDHPGVQVVKSPADMGQAMVEELKKK